MEVGRMTDAELRQHLEEAHQFGYLYAPTRSEMERDHALQSDECAEADES